MNNSNTNRCADCIHFREDIEVPTGDGLCNDQAKYICDFDGLLKNPGIYVDGTDTCENFSKFSIRATGMVWFSANNTIDSQSKLTFHALAKDMPEDIRFRVCERQGEMFRAIQVNADFKINDPDVPESTGDSGDYLIYGCNGKLFPCSQEIFDREYEWVENN